MTIAILAVLFSIFALSMAVINLIPHLLQTYRDRYQDRIFKTNRELNKFFITIKPTRIMLIGCGIAVVIGLLSESVIFAGAVAIASIFAPRILLKIWKGIRSSQVDAQLMDALILIGNSLKSGLDMAAGFELVATNMKAPISEEFGLVVNSYKLGTSLEKALIDLGTRVESRNLETMILALNIQRESGGQVIKTFEQLIITIREESKLQKKVRALTSQGRTQIYFMALFPWVLAVLFYYMAPDMFGPALRNSTGQLVLVGIIIWEAIGLAVTKRLVRVDL